MIYFRLCLTLSNNTTAVVMDNVLLMFKKIASESNPHEPTKDDPVTKSTTKTMTTNTRITSSMTNSTTTRIHRRRLRCRRQPRLR